MKRKNTSAFLIRMAVRVAGIITIGSLLALIAYILIMGVTNLRPDMFAWNYTTENASMMPAIINTLQLMAISLGIAVVIGVFSAIYLVEYAKAGSKAVKLIRLTVETLAGIPSIVYGLFGYLAFVVAMGLGYSILAGAFTMAIMVLPLIIRTTEEALMAVDDKYREGSYGLGAGKLRTVFRIVLPSAAPGILSGIILAMGRILGETAALLYTASSVAKLAGGPGDPGRTLAVHMYALLSEGLYMKEAYATSVVLLLLVLLINGLARLLFKRIGAEKKE